MELIFVCSGNICRSSMAEGLARHIWAERFGAAGDLKISSAGIAAWPGDPATPEAVFALRAKGIDIDAHRARQLTAEIADNAGLILVMTKQHKEHIIKNFPKSAGKVFLLAEFAGKGEKDVDDPYGGPLKTYQRCAERIEPLVVAALNRISNGELRTSNLE